MDHVLNSQEISLMKYSIEFNKQDRRIELLEQQAIALGISVEQLIKRFVSKGLSKVTAFCLRRIESVRLVPRSKKRVHSEHPLHAHSARSSISSIRDVKSTLLCFAKHRQPAFRGHLVPLHKSTLPRT